MRQRPHCPHPNAMDEAGEGPSRLLSSVLLCSVRPSIHASIDLFPFSASLPLSSTDIHAQTTHKYTHKHTTHTHTHTLSLYLSLSLRIDFLCAAMCSNVVSDVVAAARAAVWASPRFSHSTLSVAPIMVRDGCKLGATGFPRLGSAPPPPPPLVTTASRSPSTAVLSSPHQANRLAHGRVPASSVAGSLIILASCPPIPLGRRLLQRFVRGFLESVRLIGREVVVGIAYLIERALYHELVDAIKLRLVPARVRQLDVDLLPQVVLLPPVVLVQELLLLRCFHLFFARVF